jgi:hypothetical protein
MTIVPLQPWATNSPFFYMYATQFSKLQHDLSFTFMPPISQIDKSRLTVIIFMEKTNSFLFRPKKQIHFYLGQEKKHLTCTCKLIIDKVTNTTNTSLCFKSIHHIIINKYPSYVQIHLIISRSIISNRFRSIRHIKVTCSSHDRATCSVHNIAKY